MDFMSLSGLTRRALRRALLGGGRRWQAALFLLLLGRVMARASKLGTGPVVFRQKLREGEGLGVFHMGAPDSDTSALATGRDSRQG